MKFQKMFVGSLALCATALMTVGAQAALYEISTADPNGADAELRASQPTTNRGDNQEIASRVGGGRNSVIYMKFDASGFSAAHLLKEINVQLTVRQDNQINVGKIVAADPNFPNSGWNFFVLDPTLAGADWDEAVITPQTASTEGLGYNEDFLIDTKPTGDDTNNPTAGLTFLGTHIYRELNGDSYLAAGEHVDLLTSVGSPLHAAIVTAQGTAHQTVTIVANLRQYVGMDPASEANTAWFGQNNVMTPKEHTPEWAPKLQVVPEPTSLALAGLALCFVAVRFKRS